jgi:hypothetical protein
MPFSMGCDVECFFAYGGSGRETTLRPMASVRIAAPASIAPVLLDGHRHLQSCCYGTRRERVSSGNYFYPS